ncbi:MAG: hypothetical protein LBS33_06760 [Streptococcaceae bacterium]|jgi:hypothetical protein|nr:hypothetical protein [Streptococcaceae bacterium]
MVITGRLVFKYAMLVSIVLQSLFLLGYFIGKFPTLNVMLTLIFIGSSLLFYLAIGNDSSQTKKKT